MEAGKAPAIKLWSTKREQEMYENLSELYAIIVTTEKLERAYVKDVISPKEYEASCVKLIAQFKTLRNSLKEVVPDVQRFMTAYKMDCPAAANRLLVSGIPATVEHKTTTSETSAGATVAVAESVQHFITAMDALRLEMKAMDQIHPLLTSLLGALNNVPILPPEFEGKIKVKDWISRMNRLAAMDELSQEDCRQLTFDLESSYNSFMQAINTKY